jgi:hypothetical protein
MQIDHAQEQCHRPGCTCAVPNGEAYCGEHCRNATEGASAPDATSTPCACARDAIAPTTAARRAA